MLVYHFFTEVISKARVWKLFKQKEEGQEELHIELLAAGVDQRPLVEPTYSEVAGPAQEQPFPEHTLTTTVKNNAN